MQGRAKGGPFRRKRELTDAELMLPHTPNLTFEERLRRHRLLRERRAAKQRN
jgi:hypothetical protein